jgi:hypothetical protein
MNTDTTAAVAATQQYQQHYKRAVLSERSRCLAAIEHCVSTAEARRIIESGEQPPRSAAPAAAVRAAAPTPATPTARSSWERVEAKFTNTPRGERP